MLASTGVKTGVAAAGDGTGDAPDGGPDASAGGDVVSSIPDAGWQHRGRPVRDYSVHMGVATVSGLGLRPATAARGTDRTPGLGRVTDLCVAPPRHHHHHQSRSQSGRASTASGDDRGGRTGSTGVTLVGEEGFRRQSIV